MKIWQFLEQEGEKVWIKKQLSRDSNLQSCWPWEDNATCWCAIGLIERFHKGKQLEPIQKLKRVVGESILTWNDDPNRTFAEVVEAFKKADL